MTIFNRLHSIFKGYDQKLFKCSQGCVVFQLETDLYLKFTHLAGNVVFVLYFTENSSGMFAKTQAANVPDDLDSRNTSTGEKKPGNLWNRVYFVILDLFTTVDPFGSLYFLHYCLLHILFLERWLPSG